MHTKTGLKEDLATLGIDPKGTLLVHSSMKQIGDVAGGADTVLDALSEYMVEGLLVLPTHTWSYVGREKPVFDREHSPSCVGILTELFRQRPGVHRSLHPTHSVAALGRGAETFVRGDELCDTPCHRSSVWGRLFDRHAQIILVGVDLNRMTYFHGVEEWVDVPGRLTDGHQTLYTVLPSGQRKPVPSRRHCGSPSDHFHKVDHIMRAAGVMHIGQFGSAETRVCQARPMATLLMDMLRKDPELFSDSSVLKPDLERWALGREETK